MYTGTRKSYENTKITVISVTEDILCHFSADIPLIKYLFPNPQECYSANGAKDEVGEIALAKQFDVQQMADKGANITAYDANDKVHAASFAFTTHDAVSNITN